ncbi:terminase [Glycomyces sp. NPDC048151]|uniref:terminase n=1 Tax=Glycomyces sp. NPDC048151 TaxID=3364002 RepID=UPI0037147C84
MPRTLVRAPAHDRARSLGWLGVAWIEHFARHGPGDVQGEPVAHGDEYTAFIVDAYGLDANGRRLYDSAFLSRPKGCDKSGLAARLALFEALGPCRFDGFAEGGEVYTDPWGLGFEYVYQPGEPMGRPVSVPYIRIMATEEGQAGNTFDSVYYNLTDDECPLAHVPGIDAGLTRVNLPGGGEITPSTASSASKDGGKETFVVFDETHLYTTAELRNMYRTVTRNLRKRKKIAETWFLETTTMYAAGEESVAEQTYALGELIKSGRSRRARLLYDHRWGECEDLSDEEALRKGIAEAFGDALAWNDLDALVDEFYDIRADPADSRRYFLNVRESAGDAYLRHHEWAGRADPDRGLLPGEVITLGFDGSRGRRGGRRAKPDATALVACTMDGHLVALGVWEAPDGPGQEHWTPPLPEIEAAVSDAFRRYKVVAFYADPARDWRSYVNNWEAKWGRRLKVRVRADHPIEWWMTGGRSILVERAVEAFAAAVRNGDLTHDAGFALTRHVLNARRRIRHQRLTVGKEHEYSPNKIDACVGAILAWQARLDALARGIGTRRTSPVRRSR